MNTLLRKRLHCERLEDRRLLAAGGVLEELDNAGLVSTHPAPHLSQEVHGRVWNDLNGNGVRENNEPGLAGVTVFSDANGNGSLDGFEPWTVSRGDDPNTAADETGEYRLMGLAPGLHIVRQVVPRGMDQTYPSSAFPELVPPLPIPLPPDAHVVLLHEGQVVSGFDFGNREFVAGAVAGVKWEDLDGDGQRDENEHGLAGVWIYADVNRNGVWDRSEPWTRSVQDDPNTNVDETGRYRLTGLRPGEHLIREIIPDGFQQTFPSPGGRTDGDPDVSPGEAFDPTFATVHPELIDVQLAAGQTFFTTVSITVHVSFIQAIQINVAANTPDVLFQNLSGPQINGGSGDTSTFEVMITGDGAAHHFQIVFFDANPAAFSPIYGAIPVTIRSPGSGGGGAHRVVVEPGQTVERVNFGNQRIRPGTAHGIKWEDQNGNGQREDNEPGLAGVVIYTDMNRNGVLDEGEPRTRSMEDDPVTDFDETGMYWLSLHPGRHVIREVVPDGYIQTLPDPIILPPPFDPLRPEIGLPFSVPGAYEALIVSGQTVGDLDFGNQRIVPAAVEGIKWQDLDGDGQRDENEPGLGNVVIYSDLNGNAQFDEDEPHTKTIDDPRDIFPNDTGKYRLEGLRPGLHAIREVVPEGYRQTYPNFAYPAGTDPAIVIYPFPDGAHFVFLTSGQTQSDLDFGNQPLRPGTIAGYKWVDLNGDRQRSANEPGLAGVTIYADLDFDGVLDDNEPHTVTEEDNPDTNVNELGRYRLTLEPGHYNIREVVPNEYIQTFPVSPSLAPFPLNGDGWHSVVVEPGKVIDDLHFGNQPAEPGVVRGFKWNDLNGDSVRQDDEPGLAGVTIYSDINRNGRLDEGEPRAVSREDDPNTERDETGTYELGGLRQTIHYIREVVPEGYGQTSPIPPGVDAPGPFYNGIHVVVIHSPGLIVEGINFGNQKIVPGTVSGRKWLDRDGDLERDADEPGLGGVVIYSDENHNGRLDANEPRTTTIEDNPDTDFDEGGIYVLIGLQPGPNRIREVVPDGYVPTTPNAARPWHPVLLPNGGSADGIDFGNREAEPAGVSGRKWVDRNGNGQRDGDEPGLGGVTIYSDRNFNGMFDPDEPHTVTREDIPETDFDEAGLYSMGDLTPGLHWIREVVPVGSIQTYPQSPLAFIGADSHLVQLAPNEHRDGLDFGNRPHPDRGIPAGDFNRDGGVDDEDREMWRHTFGSTSNLIADANGDGVVNAADYVIWRNYRGVVAHTTAEVNLISVALPPTNASLAQVTEVAESDELPDSALSDTNVVFAGVSRRQLRSGDETGDGPVTDRRIAAADADADTLLRRLDRLRAAHRRRDAAFDNFDRGADTEDDDRADEPLAAVALTAAWDSWE